MEKDKETRSRADLTHKLVKRNRRNDDEYFIRFMTKEEVESYIPESELHYTKPIDPHFIEKPVWTDYCHYAFSKIEHDEWERVLKSDAWAEISCNNLMCDADGYYYLSKMIDKDMVVIDIGSSYNAQSYFFTEHAKYIAVEPPERNEEGNHWHFEHFQAPGTELYRAWGQDFIKNIFPTLGIDPDQVFCICTWVPSDEVKKMIAETFPHHYIYYPHRRGPFIKAPDSE